MKQRSATPVSKGLATKSLLVAMAVVSVLTLGPTQLFQAPSVYADEFDDKIAAIQREIDGYTKESGKLAEQANTLKNQLRILGNQKATIQAQIDQSQAKLDKLRHDITQNENKIAKNQDVLGDTLANMYIDDKISPLEMLASSKSIGDYIDKQEYRAAMRDTLVSTISETKKLKAELEKQRTAVEQVIADQQDQKSALVAKENERSALLAETRGKEAEYARLTSAGQSQQQKLRQQQQEAIAAALRQAGGGGNAVAGDPSKGGYPAKWANAPINTYVDDWGMYSRQCVSYTAWKVYQKNGYMPYWGGRGNAYEWPGNADAAGIPRGSKPKAGSVGVLYGGPWGHVVWVDSVNSDGTINISQYNEVNAMAPYEGMYSERKNVPPNTYATYIYF